MANLRSEASLLHGSLARFEHLLVSQSAGHTYGRVFELVEALMAALVEEFDFPQSSIGPPPSLVAAKIAKMKRTLRSTKRKLDESNAALADALGNRVKARIRHIWFIRVGLARPTLPMRALSDFCRDYPADEVKHMSHVYVGAARDAFCELIKTANRDTLTHLVASFSAGSNACETSPVIMCHIHDESYMKIRSSAMPASGSALASEIPNPSLSRSKHSKIQNNFVDVVAGGVSVEFFSELQPLLKKDGATIAEAICSVSAEVIKACAQGLRGDSQPQQRLRFIHLLTGDGINTNENALKRTYYYFTKTFSAHSLRYSLLAWRCASHQANLAVHVAICGELMAEPAENNALCANCVRLFKYLIPDYCEEFAAALRKYVVEQLVLVSTNTEDGAADMRNHIENMRALYGPEALPDELVLVYNCKLGELKHRCQEECNRAAVCLWAYKALYKWFLVVEDKPVVTRFWLFSSCVCKLLGMHLLGLPTHIFTLATAKVTEESAKRLTRFHAFCASPSTAPNLRKAVLCLRLTQHALNLSSKKALAEAPDVPALVQLGRGVVQARTSAQLYTLIRLLPKDESLDLLATLVALFTTELHIIIRYDQYLQYPTKLWKISKKYNPHEYASAAQDLVETKDDNLDLGYTLVLKHDACSHGNIGSAVAYLMSPTVQQEVESILENARPTSLDVERKHKQDKSSECQKVLSVARASRNSILQRYRLQRSAIIEASIKDRRQAKKDLYMNTRALAIAERPDLFSRGTGQLAWQNTKTLAERQQIMHHGDETALQAYIKQHAARLTEIKRAKQQKAKRMLQSCPGILPYTNAEWLTWLRDHDEEFRDLLKVATSHRKKISVRLASAEGRFPEAPRIYPKLPETRRYVWERKLFQEKRGFFGLRLNAVRFITIFGCSCRNQFWGFVLGRAGGGKIELHLDTAFVSICRPVRSLLRQCGFHEDDLSSDIEVFLLAVQQPTVHNDTVRFHVQTATPVELDKKTGEEHASSGSTEGDLDEWLKPYTDEEELLCSSAETEAEKMQEEVCDEEVAELSEREVEEGDLCVADMRAPSGSWVVHRTDYYYITNNPKYPDARLNIYEQWLCETELGGKPSQKQRTVAHYDPDGNPIRTCMVLRAWFLHRAAKKRLDRKKSNTAKVDGTRNCGFEKRYSKFELCFGWNRQ